MSSKDRSRSSDVRARNVERDQGTGAGNALVDLKPGLGFGRNQRGQTGSPFGFRRPENLDFRGCTDKRENFIAAGITIVSRIILGSLFR